MVLIHILTGLTAIASGLVALLAAKGSPVHRRAGDAFVVAMLLMAASGLSIALFESPSRVNTVAALLTIYLVSTGHLTVTRSVDRQRGMLVSLMVGGFVLGLWAMASGLGALGAIEGGLTEMVLLFGTVAFAGALLDARVLLAGSLTGAHRLRRHLWRMGFAMLLATTALFIGQPSFFPQMLQPIGLRAVPVFFVIAVPAYWLIKLAIRRRPRRGYVQ